MGRIITTLYRCPAGDMILGSFGDKLCLCDWDIEKRRTSIDRRICRYLKAEYKEGISDILNETKIQLDEYFAGQRKEFSIPLIFTGTDFQCSVWTELTAIPYGSTLSYAELAKRINRPQAIRAVASANAANPLSILIPCHRVIGSNNKLTGYAGGLEAKQYLLSLESDLKKLH